MVFLFFSESWVRKDSRVLALKNFPVENLRKQSDECGKICRKTHNLKIHKWLDDKPIAITVEMFGK